MRLHSASSVITLVVAAIALYIMTTTSSGLTITHRRQPTVSGHDNNRAQPPIHSVAIPPSVSVRDIRTDTRAAAGPMPMGLIPKQSGAATPPLSYALSAGDRL